jgi:hypothetical protein
MENQTPVPAKKGLSRLLYLYHPRTWKEKGLLWSAGVALLTYAIVVVILGIIWSHEPSFFDVRDNALEKAQNKKLVPGYVTTATAIRIAETLLHKPGGYISNDRTPPGIYLDNISNWEFGALTELRDTVRAMRNDFSRAQTQSTEDKDLAVADPQFNYDSNQWILPATETEYEKGVAALYRYLERLSDEKAYEGQFFTRADNLAVYLEVVRKRLGSLTQRLAASVGQLRLNIDLAGDINARQSTPTPQQQWVQTPWLQIDDIFYEARGYTWALLHMLKAIAIDFQPVLSKKNAQVSLDQIIRELEAANQRMWSPMVLNGTGYGLLANHSLVMASYIASANAAIGDLVNLLKQG